MKALIVWLLVCGASAPACVVGGTVVDGESGKPLAKTRVFARPHKSSGKAAILRIAGEQGEFCFDRLEPGEYDLLAERTGYLPSIYGGRPGAEEGLLLKIDGQAEVPPVTFKILPAATIAGVVVDVNGEPREDVKIELLHKVWDRRWTTDDINSRETDDRGYFRFGLLAPGTYYLSAQTEREGSPQEFVYYPDTPVFSRARPIVLTPGQQAVNLTITLAPFSPRHVSGSVLQRGGHIMVSLRPERGSGTEVPVSPEGRFFADGLLPARYRVQISSLATLAGKEVDLTNGDVDGLVLEPAETLDLRISVRSDGQPMAPGVTLGIRDISSGERQGRGVDKDATVSFPFLRPGSYRLESWTRGLFVKGFTIGGEAQAGTTLDLHKAPAGPVEVILSPKVAALEGQAIPVQATKPVLAVTVVAMNIARSVAEVVDERATADQTGKFQLESLEPGAYRLFAIEGFEEAPWGSLELAAALAERSVEVELHEAEHRNLEIPVISAEQWAAALRKVGM